AVPMSYHFGDGTFWMVTSPESLHGRLMVRRGRATMTVQFERCDGRSVHQWYVMAEGPVRFTDVDPLPHVRRILAKDRGAAHVDEWTAAAPAPGFLVAVLEPERLSGYEFYESLDAPADPMSSAE
ncbi:MAG TPA: hypothetical protein VLG28_11560, partial [Acidimicrobiia bacterium]|nr:hypothetical protein [Acidimicrobiia bacterium]